MFPEALALLPQRCAGTASAVYEGLRQLGALGSAVRVTVRSGVARRLVPIRNRDVAKATCQSPRIPLSTQVGNPVWKLSRVCRRSRIYASTFLTFFVRTIIWTRSKRR